MFKLICGYCNEDIVFEDPSVKPEICQVCGTSTEKLEYQEFSETEADQSASEKKPIPNGLILTYQQTGEIICITGTNKVVLGGKAFGSDVLGKIPFVSRTHCSIEFVNDEYVIADLNSTNGTFVGVSKIDCRSNPNQTLNDSDLIFLGKEAFLVKHTYNESSKAKADLSEETEDNVCKVSNPKENKGMKYRCLGCGKEFKEKTEICEGCGLFDTWEIVS